MTGQFDKDLKQLENEGSFQNKFGIKITKSGITAIPTILFYIKNLGLNYSDFYLICLILSRKYGKSWPYFSLNKVTRELKIPQDTLHKAKNRLIKKEFLRIIPRKENHKGKGRNTYDLTGLFCILEMLVDANFDKFFKTNHWDFKDHLDFAFLKQAENEKLSEIQRAKDSDLGEHNKIN